jgi:putative ABC transport system permease protein
MIDPGQETMSEPERTAARPIGPPGSGDDPPPASGGRRSGSQFFALALKDLWHDRRTALVLVLTVAAIVAPLLLLLGLKTGVIATMRSELTKDPRNLEIVIYGAHRLDRAWLSAMRERPEVAFLVPRTRSINATIDLMDRNRRPFEALDLAPTAPGDPLLPDDIQVPADASQVLLTETLARRMGISAGAEVVGTVRRSSHGSPENAELTLKVVGVVPESRIARDAVLAHLDLLVASEDYRDGLRETIDDADLRRSISTRRTEFAGARIYARSLEDVAPLAAAMRTQHIEVRTQAERIATVRAFDRTLSFVLRVVGSIALAGCALALGGALWINVERKRRDLALLRLFGFPNATVVLMPMVQSAVVAAGAFLLAYFAYLVGAATFDQILGRNLADKGYLCRLDPGHLIEAAVLVLGVALIAAIAAGYRASRIDPAECLRDL